MPRLIYTMMTSADGYVETPDKQLDWVTIDEELHAFANALTRETGISIYGGRMYQLMADYWPTYDTDPNATPVEAEYARIWRERPKVVFSRTLESVAWNSRLVRDDLAGEIARLKAEPGPDLDVSGATLAASCIRLGLVDEFGMMIHPVMLGAGTRYFPPDAPRIPLRLLETRTFSSGVVYLRYERDQEAPLAD